MAKAPMTSAKPRPLLQHAPKKKRPSNPARLRQPLQRRPLRPLPHRTVRAFLPRPLRGALRPTKGWICRPSAGSGPHGRIVKADVEDASASAKPAAAATAAPAAASAAPAAMASGPSADTVAKMYADRDYEEVALDGMRKTIAARLTEAKQSIPHFYLRRDIKLDALLKFRGQLNKQLESRGVKLSVNDFIIKACALALQSVPDANAVWAGDRMLKLKPSDVAVAVAIEGGLFTPVLRDAEMKSLSALSAEMKDLAARARDRKLAPHEYQGGSFAISNLGMFGIDNFDAVINPPHGAILAVGAGVKKPVVGADGELSVATVMSMTLSVDHRVIDGALGAQLLQAIVDNLENPMVDAGLIFCVTCRHLKHKAQPLAALFAFDLGRVRLGFYPEHLIHRNRRLVTSRLAHDPGGNTGHSLAGRHIFQHDRTGGDPAAMADLDIAQHLGPCTDQNAIADFRMAVFLFLAGATQRDRMQHRHIVPDHGGFTDHDRMGVVNHDPAPDLGRRMNVDSENLRNAHLHEIGQIAFAMLPQPMPDPIGLHRLIPLEKQDWLQEPVAGRIAFIHRHQIGPRRRHQIGRIRIGIIRDFAQDHL